MGGEATIHAARSYLSGMQEGNLMLKLDFKNAFNSIHRDHMLHEVLKKVPDVFPLAYSTYHQPSFLFFGNYVIHSCEGVQQGDPLGPLLFCVAVQDLIRSLCSEFCVFYLDDGTLGGPLDVVSSDLHLLEQMAHQIGLRLNHRKSESICVDDTTRSSILSLFPSLTDTPPEVATLLGSPIGGIESIDGVIRDKVHDLRTLGERLILLQAHDALCLLKNAFSLPKLLYTIRSAPCFQSDLLDDFDNLQRSLLESICNINLVDSAWLQASLPATSGGLGVRSAVMLAPSAYLASAAGCAHLYQALLPEKLHSQDAAIRGHALEAWCAMLASEADPPTGAEAILQRNWDGPVVKSHFNSLLSSADPKGKTRLLACQQKESGAWLSAPPTSALGLRMVNDTIRVAVGLRLGAQLCATHSCPHCGTEVDTTGVHGLSCRRSEGRIPRHAALNNIVHRTLTAANIPATLEPRGLCRLDGKRPDGLTIIPWAKGRTLVWDVTCWDSFAPSNIRMSSSRAGSLADHAAERKRSLYEELSITHIFQPIAFESTGVFGQDALDFFYDLAQRSRCITHDPLTYLKLCQKISVCMQNFNAVSINGCCTV